MDHPLPDHRQMSVKQPNYRLIGFSLRFLGLLTAIERSGSGLRDPPPDFANFDLYLLFFELT